MSTSMRNAIQRRSHRERAQPHERKRLGLLEKHKDYKLRAKDWAKKQATLRSLREKAAERNEDEFSYKMLSRQRGPGTALTRGSDEKRDRHFTGTVAGDRGGRTLPIDTVRLLKSQDSGYLRTMRNVAAKEVAQLQERATIARAFVGTKDDDEEEEEEGDEEEEDDEEVRRPRKARKPIAKKIVFADSPSDRDAAFVDEMEKREGDDDGGDSDDDTPKARQARRKAEAATRLERRLALARARLRALDTAEQQLDLQRARMAKTATMDIETRSGRRIKVRERKR
ncbi:u3 small nucleolar RNA-associated protein [Niveomyces insectorum RCEF 264]|uniref:U3 small nucleolar RNA-associated protein 11 n=1 Tax=Niveomyces insectorum RCEF 264 TaxID=1081102 RepID=A0A167VJ04_9HYPO|nr:u3 small nucleolar RNA-associated protein [Niveomyces insectorum RCEF 264]